MPNGKTHQLAHTRYRKAFYVVSAITCVIVVLVTKSPIWVGIVLWAGSLFGWQQGKYIEPDLDQLGMTISEGTAIRNFGIGGWIFTGWWTAYAVAMNIIAYVTGTQNGGLGAHRTFWTHSYVFSTAIRFVWLYAPMYITAFRFLLTMNIFVIVLLVFNLGNFQGLAYSDALHIYMDKREEK